MMPNIDIQICHKNPYKELTVIWGGGGNDGINYLTEARRYNAEVTRALLIIHKCLNSSNYVCKYFSCVEHIYLCQTISGEELIAINLIFH